MPADHTKPVPVLDVVPSLPADPPPQGRHRRRALRPAVAVAAAIAATALGATVGTLAYGSGQVEQAAFGTAAVAPEATAAEAPEATATSAPSASAAGVGVGIAGQAPAGATSVVPTPGSSAPTGPPTGTGAVGGPGSAAHAATAPATGDATAESAVLTLVNQERAKAGCQPLTVDARLTAAARAHSADMAGRRYFAHDTPDGVSVGTRVTQAGYRWSLVGENIAEGQPDAAAVMKAWMNSPGHRANILNCRFTNIGIGLARQGRTPLWTQDFGRPR